MLTPASTIAIIGFGTTGAELAALLARRGCAVRVYATGLDDPAARDTLRDHIEAAGADPASTLADALWPAKLVIATDEVITDDAARNVAALLRPGQIYLDLCATPDAQRTIAAARLEAAGGHHVAGVLRDELLLKGRVAPQLAEALVMLGLQVTVVDSLPPVQHVTTRISAPSSLPLRRGELP